jgi:AcrR family transcriptional regulator
MLAESVVQGAQEAGISPGAITALIGSLTGLVTAVYGIATKRAGARTVAKFEQHLEEQSAKQAEALAKLGQELGDFRHAMQLSLQEFKYRQEGVIARDSMVRWVARLQKALHDREIPEFPEFDD